MNPVCTVQNRSIGAIVLLTADLPSQPYSSMYLLVEAAEFAEFEFRICVLVTPGIVRRAQQPQRGKEEDQEC